MLRYQRQMGKRLEEWEGGLENEMGLRTISGGDGQREDRGSKRTAREACFAIPSALHEALTLGGVGSAASARRSRPRVVSCRSCISHVPSLRGRGSRARFLSPVHVHPTP